MIDEHDFTFLNRHLSRHIRLTTAQAELLRRHLSVKNLARKEFLVRTGEVCRTENFVVQGVLRMYHVDDSGAEHNVQFAAEDWWVSDLYSFLSQRPGNYAIQALEKARVLQLGHGDLQQLYLRIPPLERFFRLLFQNAFVAQQERIREGLSVDAAGRYHHFMDRYPALASRISQKHLAAYLGISPVFLSVLRRRAVKS